MNTNTLNIPSQPTVDEIEGWMDARPEMKWNHRQIQAMEQNILIYYRAQRTGAQPMALANLNGMTIEEAINGDDAAVAAYICGLPKE